MLKAMRPLRDDAAWFARAREVKCWYIATTANLGKAVMKLVIAQECHADNKSLFFAFEEPFMADKEGWLSRSSRLRADFAAKQKGLSEAGIGVRPLGPAAEPRPGVSEVGEFTEVLQEVVGALADPLVGVVVVLAPTRIESAESVMLRLRTLMQSPLLRQVRWVVVERDTQDLRGVTEGLPEPQHMESECIADPGELKKDWAALAGPVPSAELPPLAVPAVGAWATPAVAIPDGSVPEVAAPKFKPWKAPGAGPDVVAPVRKREVPAATDEQLRAMGMSPLFVNGGGDLLNALMMHSALALGEGRHGDAVRMQTQAADLCARMEMPREQILNTMVLGSYLLATGQLDQARVAYERALALAEQNQATDQAANAHLALGTMAAKNGQPQVAMGHYSAAAQLASKANNPVLAVECWRIAGRLAYDHQAPDAAFDAWNRGVEVANGLAPEVAQKTSAAEVARGLAAIHRDRGAEAEARQLEVRAYMFEQGLQPGNGVGQS